MESYWKVNEVAAVLQISIQTIYRYVANGEIPFHKLNRSVRFKPSEIKSWIESKKSGVMLTGETEILDNICKTENDGSEV